MASYNIAPGGMLGTIMQTAGAAEERRRRQMEQNLEMLKSGFRTTDPAQDQMAPSSNMLGQIFGTTQQLGPESYVADQALHPVLAESKSWEKHRENQLKLQNLKIDADREMHQLGLDQDAKQWTADYEQTKMDDDRRYNLEIAHNNKVLETKRKMLRAQERGNQLEEAKLRNKLEMDIATHAVEQIQWQIQHLNTDVEGSLDQEKVISDKILEIEEEHGWWLFGLPSDREEEVEDLKYTRETIRQSMHDLIAHKMTLYDKYGVAGAAVSRQVDEFSKVLDEMRGEGEDATLPVTPPPPENKSFPSGTPPAVGKYSSGDPRRVMEKMSLQSLDHLLDVRIPAAKASVEAVEKKWGIPGGSTGDKFYEKSTPQEARDAWWVVYEHQRKLEKMAGGQSTIENVPKNIEETNNKISLINDYIGDSLKEKNPDRKAALLEAGSNALTGAATTRSEERIKSIKARIFELKNEKSRMWYEHGSKGADRDAEIEQLTRLLHELDPSSALVREDTTTPRMTRGGTGSSSMGHFYGMGG